MIAVICVILFSSGLAGAYYVFHYSQTPHLGVVSKKTLSEIVDTSSISSTNITNNTNILHISFPGNATSMFGTSYQITKGPLYGNLVLMSYHFDSSLYAHQYYDNHSTSFQKSWSIYNDTYRGFIFTWYGNLSGPLANHIPFYAVGVDGSYAFLITSYTEMSSNATNVGNLIHDQIDSMI